jgi:hypothetical protein
MSSNYPPGVTGMEPEITGEYNYGMEREYMKAYLAKVKKTISETHILLNAQYLLQGYPHGNNLTHLEHLERILENNYVIKDGLEMSLIQLDQEEAGL